MTNMRHKITKTIGLVVVVTLSGCNKSNSPEPAPQPPPQPTATPQRQHPPALPPRISPGEVTPTAMPPGHPAVPDAHTTPASAAQNGPTLKLTGISLTVPEGWIAQPTPTGPMAPKAVFALPHTGESGADGSVRITYFPGMKGKDEMNIDRWVRQARHADGTPLTRSEAKIEKKEFGNVRVTTVDVSGSIQATMRGEPKAGSRMIAAIVDHPRGPHFVSIVGDEETMNHWEPAIRSFLRSAKAE